MKIKLPYGGGYIRKAFALVAGAVAFVVAQSVQAEDAYVQSYGATTVNTKYHASGKTKISVDFQLTQVKTGNDCVFGHYAKGGEFTLLVYCPREAEIYAEAKDDTHVNAARLYDWDAASGFASSTPTKSDTERHVVVIDAPNKQAELFSADGVLQSRLKFPAGWTYAKTSKFPLALFGAANNAAGAAQQCVYAKIYGVKIWETEDGATSLVHEYVPAVKEGYSGFYDTVEGRFFGQTEPQKAALTSGGDVLELDDDPYIESDGSVYSVVDTRYFPTSRTKVEVDFRDMDSASGKDITFGHYATTDYSLLIYHPGAVGAQTYKLVAKDEGYPKGGFELSPKVTVDTRRHVAVFDIPGRRVEMRDPQGGVQGSATLSSDWTYNFNTVNTPLMMFGNATDRYGNSGQRAKARIYGVRIYENEAADGSGAWTTVHDFVPHLLNGVPGFRDAVTGKFIAGGVVAGGDLPETDESDPYIDTTTANATISFDTGYNISSNTCVVCDYRILKQKAEQQFLFEAGDSGHVNEYSFMRVYANGSTGTGGISYACGKSRYIVFNPNNGIPFTPNVRRTVTLDAYNRKLSLSSNGETIWQGDLPEESRVSEKSQNTLKIFSAANGKERTCMARLFSFQIYEEGKLARDYRPYVKGGMPGLLDTAGDGGFITSTTNSAVLRCGGGIQMSGRPDAYLENDAVTVLDLGYKANMKSRIEFDFQWLKLDDKGKVACGSWNDGALHYCIWHYNSGIQYIFCGNAKTYQSVPGITADLMRHTAVFDMKNRSLAYITDGVEKKVAVNGSATFNDGDVSGANMGVFDGLRSTGLAQGMTSHARVYAVRIYEDDKLIHEFLPYSNGEITSLYDTQTGYIATKTANKADTVPAWPTIGGMGVDGAERYIKPLPETAAVGKDSTITLTAAASGAIRYEWALNGDPIDGATGESVSVAWRKGAYNATDEYTCTPVYDVFGVETRGTPVSCAVSHLPAAFLMVVR